MSRAMRLRENDLDTPEKRGNYTISIVGCGRMGLPTACLFAEAGFRVICVDADPYVVNMVKKGVSPFAGPGLERLLKKNLREHRLTATVVMEESVPFSNIIVFVVPALIDQKKRSDYSYLEKACRDAGLNLQSGTLIIIESTLGPGITETLVKDTFEMSSGLEAGVDFGLAYSPIRATAGKALEDIASYPRVIGAIDKESLEAAKAVLGTMVKGGIIEVSSIKTAEAIKLFENLYRDTNIALANELAQFCEKAGIDFIEAREAANTQPYCHLLIPGIVSGHIGKDPHLLLEEAENLGVRLPMVTLARKINDATLKQAFYLLKDALYSCGKSVRRAKVSVLGVSYRPNIKESRDSLVEELVNILINKGIKVRVYDPLFSYKELIGMRYPAERTLTRAVEGADCIIIAVGHDRFTRLNLRKIGLLVKKPAAIVDLGHVLNPFIVEKQGLVYRGLGRGVWKK